MKKIFTLFVAFLALTFCAKAQVTIILEAHDVWQDGTGYQLLLDADHNTYGTIIPESGALTDGGDVPASVYAEFEYKVPVNADGSLTTTNIVYDGSATITIPAGTYDFCITNPTPGGRMWIANDGIDPTRADDYVFVDGCTYHFLMVYDDGYDACQLTVTMNPTSPTIITSPTSLDFGPLALGGSKTSTITVSNYLITNNLTATTSAPFEISIDGTTFGTTATIPAAGGTLSVRYTATDAGIDSGAITISSTEVTDDITITLTGKAVDCNNVPIPYSCDFTDAAQNLCWTTEDANNDGFTFNIAQNYGLAYYGYNETDSTMGANDWLISPVFSMTNGLRLSFDYAIAGADWPEKFQVFAIGADTVALTPVITAINDEDFETMYVQLNNLSGNYQIAFHCISDANMYQLFTSNFSIVNDVPTLLLSEEALDFNIVEMGSISEEQMVVITAVNITDSITVSVAAPYEISNNGQTYDTTLTIPASTELANEYTIFVRFAPTAAGTFSQDLTVTAGTLSEIIALTGESMDCSLGITLPYTNDFNAGIAPPTCWSYGYDAENFDPAGFSESDYGLDILAEDFVITPEIHTTAPMTVSFDIMNYFGTDALTPTYFHVGYSTTNNNPDSFTWLGDALCEADVLTPYSAIVPAGTKYVAVGVAQLGTGLFWGMFELDDEFLIDNFSLTEQSEPLMVVSPESLSFGKTIFGTLAPAKTASVVGALLTSDINVTAPANFEVSTNGTSYAATATLPQDGGNLYVRYNPSAVGNHSGNITLTCGSISKTIAVSGIALDCSGAHTLPFTENFEGGDIPDCWLVNSTSNETWQVKENDEGYTAYCKYANEGIQQDEDFITPTLDLSNYSDITLTFQFKTSYSFVMSDNPAEQFTLYIYTSTDNGATFSNTPIFNLRNEPEFESWSWTTAVVDLSPLAGNSNVKLNFNYYGVYGAELYLDNISITNSTSVKEYDNIVRIYPNPVQNMLNINANSNIDRVEVFNMMGQMVGSYNTNGSTTQINTSNFANGVYTVKIATENGTTTSKFTVAR